MYSWRHPNLWPVLICNDINEKDNKREELLPPVHGESQGEPLSSKFAREPSRTSILVVNVELTQSDLRARNSLYTLTPKWPWPLEGTPCVTIIPESQMSVSFALHLAVFELGAYFDKSALNNPKMTLYARSKVPHVRSTTGSTLLSLLHSMISHFQDTCNFSFSHWSMLNFKL